MGFTDILAIEQFLVGAGYYLPLVIAAIFIVGLGFQVAYPRKITWIDHFPVPEETNPERRFRNGEGA